MMEKELLEGFPIFADMPQESILEIAQCGKSLEYRQNETIFTSGANASDIYGVVDGEVELSLVVKDKILKTKIKYEESVHTQVETIENEVIIDSIEPGEIFGWSALISPKLFTATAKSAKPSMIISIPADKLKEIFVRNTPVGYVFMEKLAEIISQRLRHRTDKLIESWSQAFGVPNSTAFK